MKMFIIAYSAAFDDIVISRLGQTGMRAYTKWTKALGCGAETEAKNGSLLWPAENDVLTVVVSTEETAKFKDVIQHLKKEQPRAGLRCFIVPVEEVI